jgi:2-hydroxychromene-2-carboxylate isomerase
MPHEIEFFFDIASPYSYLAATQIDAVGERAGVAVRWKPFLLGGVFKAVGNQTPAALQPKAAWAMRDLARWAAHYGVEFSMSAHFPINSLTTQRALVAARRVDEAMFREFASTLYRDHWIDGVDVSTPEAVADAADRAGLTGAQIVEMTAEQAIKDELIALTEEAVDRGAFGAPTFFVDGEMFWGNDRLHFVEQAVRGEL